MHNYVCFQMPNFFYKDLRLEAFKFLSEKLPLSQKLKEVVSHFFCLYFQQLSIARYQVSLDANSYFE